MIYLIVPILTLQIPGPPPSTPTDAVMFTWEAVTEGNARQLLNTLAPLERSTVLEISGALLDSLSTMDDLSLGRLFASVRLEAAPGEVSLWEPLDCLELLVYSPAHADYLSSCSLHVEPSSRGDSAASLKAVVRTPGRTLEYGIKAVRIGECWKVIGASEILMDALAALPEPWPRMGGT
ncbi:hypothetical protein GF402_05055 [Candidatus Fermentibacteria bacterium]|nr:hypothetical protein [Candidatus Fermentibacteria bacterium]